MSSNMTLRPLFWLGTIALFLGTTAFAEEAPSTPVHPPAVGEAFGQPILKDEFDFTLKTVSIFNVNTKEPQSEEERLAEAWKHTVFLREARKRGQSVPRQDVEKELARLLSEKGVVFGSLAYHDFVKQNFAEDAATFERRIEELLTVKRMLDGIMNPPKPVITKADAKQKFLNQYNSMATEFVRFETLEEANAFHKKITQKKWDAEKAKDKKWATPTGHISLEALIDLWQVPTEDAYRVHKLSPGKIAAPAKMYKGYGVFRMIEKKTADLKEYSQKKEEEYLKILEQVYYYNQTQKVVQDIVKEAAIKDYAHDRVMVMETTAGTVEISLFTRVAPKACENFMGLAAKNYYDGLTFHRVIPKFMIQGGDPKGDGSGGTSIWGTPFEDEVRDDIQFDHAGLLAMANSGPATNGSQFFITVAPTPHLNKKHTIFGEVLSGYDIVKTISETPTGPNDKPLTEQKIIRLYLKKWPTSLEF